MSRVSVLLLTTIILLAVAASASLGLERTPSGSFLVYRTTTVNDLRYQVMNNPVVRERYTKHFGVSASELMKYFADNVELISLKMPLKTKAWYVDKKNRVFVKTKLFPRGTMVFATKDGEPLLAWACGNPLRASLPKSVVAKAVLKPAASTLSSSEAETKVLANPVETITAAAVTSIPATAEISVLPVAAPPVGAELIAPEIAIAPAIAGPSLGWLGLLGGLFALPQSDPNPNPPVPEPATLLALGTGLALAPISLIKRSRGRR